MQNPPRQDAAGVVRVAVETTYVIQEKGFLILQQANIGRVTLDVPIDQIIIRNTSVEYFEMDISRDLQSGKLPQATVATWESRGQWVSLSAWGCSIGEIKGTLEDLIGQLNSVAE